MYTAMVYITYDIYLKANWYVDGIGLKREREKKILSRQGGQEAQLGEWSLNLSC